MLVEETPENMETNVWKEERAVIMKTSKSSDDAGGATKELGMLIVQTGKEQEVSFTWKAVYRKLGSEKEKPYSCFFPPWSFVHASRR